LERAGNCGDVWKHWKHAVLVSIADRVAPLATFHMWRLIMSLSSRVYRIAALCACITIANTGAHAQERTMTYSVMTLGGKTVGGTAFVADVVLRPYEQVDAGTTSRKFWGTDGWKPERVVAKLALKLGEKSIIVPQEAIGDLADVSLPRGFDLIGQGDAVIVYLHGGDGPQPTRLHFW